MNQGEHWWEDFEQARDWILEPMKITWADFKKMDYIRGSVQNKKYKVGGFSTPSRKFELFSTMLESGGYDPLPQYHEPPESLCSTPEIHKAYPYILITGRRLAR